MMLKFFKILSISIITVSCATRDYKMLTKQVAEYGIQKLDDKDNKVSCYVYRDSDTSSLSCVRVSK